MTIFKKSEQILTKVNEIIIEISKRIGTRNIAKGQNRWKTVNSDAKSHRTYKIITCQKLKFYFETHNKWSEVQD